MQASFHRHLRCYRGSLNGLRCGANHVDDTFRLGEHRHVAAVELIAGCPHALGKKTLQIGMHGKWSFLPTMYQLGFDFQAVPPAFALNKSGLGTP